MSVQIPSELHWLVQIVCGDEWPQGDEDKLRILATAWDEASRELTAVQNEVDSVTAAVLSALQGTASEEFRKFTETFKKQVPDVAVTAKQLGDLARETALQVEYAKYMIIGTLIMLAVQIAWAIANAFWTFGASTATIPAMQAAARISVQAVLKHLIMAVLFGIVFQVGMDAAIQGIQMLKGDRTKWDTDLTKGAAITGTIGGVIGFGLGAAASKFVPKFARSIPGEMTKGGLHEWLTEQVSGVVQGNWHGLNPAAASAGAIEGAVDGAGGRKKRGGGTQAGTNKIANTHIDGVDKLDLSKMPSMTDSPVIETDGKPTRDPSTRAASAQPDAVPSPQQSTSDNGGKAATTDTPPPPAPVQPVTTPSTTPKQPEQAASPKTEPAPAPPKTQPVATEPVKPAVTPESAKAAQPKPTVPQPEPYQQATPAKSQPVQSSTTQPQPSHQPAQSPVTHAQTEPAPQPVRTQHAEPTQAATPPSTTSPSTTTTSASTAHAPATAQPVATTQPATQPTSPVTAPAPQGIPVLDGPDKAGPQTPPHGSQLAASTPASTVTPPPVSAEPKPGHPAPQPTPVPVSTTATTITPPPIAPSTSDTPIPRSAPPMSRPAPPPPQETGHRYQSTIGSDRRYQPTLVAHPVPSSHIPPPAPAGPPPPARPAPVSTELSAVDITTRLDREIRTGQDDGHNAVLGKDPFGDRSKPPAPHFLSGYDFAKLHAAKRAGFFESIDLTRKQPTSDGLRPAALAERPDRVTEGRLTGRTTGLGRKRQKVPHLVHSIWMGGPLANDRGSRAQFLENVADSARRNPDFDFVVWTDVPRAEFDAVREPGGQRPTPRHAEVKEMLSWAIENNVRLANIDEVFNADHPMRFDAEVRAERARRNGSGYAAASDLVRLEILNRFGGVYTDGDNKVVGDLAGNVREIADNRLGIGISVERDGKRNNSAIVAAAGIDATRHYLDIIGGNVRQQYLDVHAAGQGGTREHFTSDLQHKFNAQKDARDETIYRTGPNPRTFGELAKRLGIEVNPKTGPTKDTFPSVHDEVVRVESQQSWLGPTLAPVVSEQTVLDTVKGAVMNLHREYASRPGYLVLAPVAQAITRLPDGQRAAAWSATLDLFARTHDGAVRAVSTKFLHQEPNSTVKQDHFAALPPEAATRLRQLFPGAEHIGAPPARPAPPVPAPPPPPPPAPPLSPPAPRVAGRAPRPVPTVAGVETEWPRNRQPEWYQGLRDGIAKQLPDTTVPDPLTVHATHKGARQVEIDLAPVRAGFNALFQELRDRGVRVPEVRVSAERVVQVDKTTFAKHFTLDMVSDPDGNHPDPVVRAEILAPDFIRDLARPDSAARQRLDQLTKQFEIADLLEISESNPARATSGQVLVNSDMLGELTPAPAHQSEALRHLLAHEFMHLHAHDPGRAFAGHPDEGVYRHEINTDEAVTELLARMVTDALADRDGTKPEYLRFPETFAPAPGGLRYQPNITAFDRALGGASVTEVLGSYFGPAESSPPVARPMPPRPPVALGAMEFASPDGQYLFEEIKKTPANARGDADKLWVRRGGIPPAFAVPTGRVGDRKGSHYVEYQTELFVNDCLHTAEEILNNQQYPYDLAPGQKQHTVPLRSQVSGTERLFGNSAKENRAAAEEYLEHHGANANENAAPLRGQAFVMVPTKDAPHDGRDHAPYHAAAVVAVGEGYVITAERFADNVDAKDHDRGRGKFRVYPVGTGSEVPGYSIGRASEPAKTFHEFTKVNFEGRDPITIVVEAAPDPGPPAKRRAVDPERVVLLDSNPNLVVSAPELRSVTTVHRDGERLVIKFDGKPRNSLPAKVDIAGVARIVIHGQGGGGSLALPVTTKEGESRRWVPPAVAAEVIDEVLSQNNMTRLPIELRVSSTEQASRYSLAQVLADRRQQNITAGGVVFEAGKDGVPPSLDARVKSQLEHQPRYQTRGRAAPVALDVGRQPLPADTADWAQPKNPLQPSKWESLRDKAPVRTVDYEARDILRSSTPKKLDFIPGLVRYDVRRMEVEPGRWVQEYTLKVHLEPGDGISPQALADARAKALAGVDSLLNKGYRLPSGDQFHVRVEFTGTGPHTTVKLTDSENANQVEWGTATPQNVLAHEIAHYFGLPDEYRDSGPWKRIFNSDGKPLPDGRKPLNSVVEDGGLMGQQVHHAPMLLPRHLWRIEQTMTSQVHLPDGSHSVLTDPKSPVRTPLDLPKHGFRSPEESPGPVPPARPNQDGQVLLDRMARDHTFSSGEREVLRRIVDGLPKEIATDPALADRIVSEIPTAAVELAGNLASLRETVVRWQARQVAPADITGLIVAHADEVVRKALATAVRIAEAPAHPWAVVALGGYGRKELAPASDLDFAIIGDVEDGSPGHHRLHLLQNLTCDVLNLARERLNASLPPGIEPVLFQADPLWLPTHKSARPEWLAKHTLVTAGPGLPNFGIGFDARMVPVDLPDTDASVFDRFREPHERVSPVEAKQALGDLIPSAKSTMDIKGKFDVKETLLRPLTLGTRWLGASEGQLGRSNTADRLRTLGDLGVLKRDQATELRAAFDTVQGLRQKLHAHYGRENDEARLPAPLTSRISALFAGSPAKPDHVYVLTDAEAKSVLAARDTIARYLDFLDGYRLPSARPAPQKTGFELSERQHTELGRLGRQERWVPADGWCLFHALAATAGERLGGATSEQIRYEIANRVQNATGPEADRYRLLLTPAEGQTAMTLAEAAEAIRADSGYYTTVVGDLAVQAAADRYGLRLSMVNGDGSVTLVTLVTSVTSVGDGHEVVVLVRTLDESKAAHFWATAAQPEPVIETPQAPVTEVPQALAPGTAPDYLNQGLLGTGHVEQVLGNPVSKPDAITAALVDAMPHDLPPSVEKQARQAILTLVEQHGPSGTMRRLLAGEQLVGGDTPVRVRLRVTGTQAAPVGSEAPTVAVTSTVSTTATTSAAGIVNPLSAAVAVTSAVADGHFLTVKPTLKPIDERTGQQATTHTAETTRSVAGTGETGFDVAAVLEISAGDWTRTTVLPSALRVRYPGEASSVTADRQAITAPDAIHRVFGVVEDAEGLTAIRDALLNQPGIVPGSPLHRAITDRFSVDTPATHGGHLLGGVLTATDGTASVAVRSRPTHFQRVGTGALTLEQSVGSTQKDKTAHAGAFGAEVGVAVSYGAPGVKIPSGEVKIAATASASVGPARSLTTAAAIEGSAKTTLKYDGDTVLYRVDTEYAVEGTGLDYRETHEGQVYVRVPSWQAAEFEAALRGENATAVSETTPLKPPTAPARDTAVALSAVDSVTGLEHVTGRATELLDEFFVDRKTQLDTVKARLAEALSVANLRDSYEQLRDGLRVPISVAGRDLTLTVKAYLGGPPAARRVGTVEIASSTGSTGSVESKDTKSSNRGVGLEAAAKIGLDRDKPGLLAGLTLGGTAKWQDADSSANSAAAGSTHKLTYSGPGVAVDYPATFEVALAEGGHTEGRYVSGAVRMVLPESDCVAPTFAAIPAASTGAVSLPPGSALPGRLDHVDKVNAAIAQALAVTRKGVGAWRGLAQLTVSTAVAQARFDRMLNGGLDLQLLAPGAVHRRTDAVRVELELHHPKLVGDGEGVTSETRHTSSAGTESGHSKSWGVEGYAQAGAGVAAGVRKGVGGEEGTTDSVGGKNTSTIKRSGTHLKYRADAVYRVTAYSWQDGLGASGRPATHRIQVALPEGVEYWMPKDRAKKANLPVPEATVSTVSTVDSKVWYLPEHLATGKSLGNAAVDEVSSATLILPEARRLLIQHASEFAPHSLDTDAPTGAIPALRAAFSPSDVKAALRRAAATGQSVVVHRSTWLGSQQLEIRVGAGLDTAKARSTGLERITTDSTAEGSSAHATSKTKNSTIAATLDGMAPKVQADPASTVGGVPAGGLLAGAQTSDTDSTSHTVKNADKIKGGGRSVRFEVPVEYQVEIFRDGKRVDSTILRDGTASLLVPEELCPTTEAAGAVASHPGAVDLRGAKVLAQAMPGGPELAAELRRLITDSANDVAFFRADGTTKLVAEGGHGGQKTAVFTDEDLRIGNFGRLLDGIGQTVVDNDLATTTGYRFGMRLEVVSPELLGEVELTTEQATKVTTETGTAGQATTIGNLSLGGTVQGATGPGTTGGTPGTAATTKKSTAAQTTGTGNREETVTHSGTYYRYRATARYDLSVAREQGNVLDRRFGTGTRHRVVTVPDGVYFLVPKAEAERVKLPLPGQPPTRRSAAEPEAPVDRELPREPDEAGRHWSALSTVEALKLAMNASSAMHEEEDEDDVRITPPPSIAWPESRA